MYICFDLGGTALKYGYGTPERGLLHHGAVHLTDKSRQGIYRLMLSTASELLGRLPAGEHIEAVALGSPGIVDAAAGRILSHCPNLPQWQGAEPGDELRRELGVPVFVDNDANLMTYGEASRFGFSRIVLGITLGTGIGGGLVMGREIYTGSAWQAMELGHTIVEPGGRPCNCGRRGCIEKYASATAIVELAQTAMQQASGADVNEMDNPTVKQILDYAVDNKTVHDVILHQIDRLGLVLANAITLLAPDVLLVGGGLCEIASFPWEALERSVRSNLLHGKAMSIAIERAGLGNRAALVGGLFQCRHKMENNTRF